MLLLDAYNVYDENRDCARMFLVSQTHTQTHIYTPLHVRFRPTGSDNSRPLRMSRGIFYNNRRTARRHIMRIRCVICASESSQCSPFTTTAPYTTSFGNRFNTHTRREKSWKNNFMLNAQCSYTHTHTYKREHNSWEYRFWVFQAGHVPQYIHTYIWHCQNRFSSFLALGNRIAKETYIFYSVYIKSYRSVRYYTLSK